MLKLDDPAWENLAHAYGTAEDIPSKLARLSVGGLPCNDSELWSELWSALAHQGDVYSGSFATVPHVVDALALAPDRVSFDYFQFPAWVEICRCKKQVAVPPELEAPYRAALARLPLLVAQGAAADWDDGFVRCALAAVAASKGQLQIAEAVLELSPDIAVKFLDSYFDGAFL